MVSKFLIENGFKFLWPKNKKFAICLTHDVDNLRRTKVYKYLATAKLVKRMKFKTAFNRFFKKEGLKREFEEIMELEKKYKAKSTFYFLSTTKQYPYKSYKIENIKKDLKYINDEGWEIGLHGGYYSYLDLNAIKKEKKKIENIIGKELTGYRNHYLRFKIPDTWQLLAKVGFKHDSTFGYNDMPGFRNGMCHPFKPFDLRKNKEINIVEVPLNIMDVTLFNRMKLDFGEAWKICKNLIDSVKNLGGVITILWHNRSFDEISFPGWKKIYEKILEYGYKNNAWLTSCEEIWRWCDEQQFC